MPRVSHTLLLSLVLCGLGLPRAADAEEKEERIAIAVTPMVTRGPIEHTEVEGLELVLAAALQNEPRVRAIMPSEIQTLLGLEAQKQLMGCESDSSCLAEIGGALGAPYVLSSQVSRVGSTWLLQLSILDAAASETVHRATRETDGIDPLVKAIKSAVAEILPKLPELQNAAGPRAGSAATTPSHVVAAPNKGSRTLFWIGLGTGVAMVAAGGGIWAVNESTIARHNDASLALQSGTVTQPSDYLLDSEEARSVKAGRNVGVLLTGLGAALIAADVTLGALGGGKTTQAAIVPLEGGAYATLRWRLP
ncbi:MAG: hypothetical protein P1V51_00545 [Deltaproteobacteria bacterium]|nr:hypothetical protein [Deltaproteobacteria bacterium]